MSWIDWIIMIVPMSFVIYMGFYSRKYIRGVTDYLAAGRLAGRYVISVGDMATGLAVLTLLGAAESNYKAGLALGFWSNITLPIAVFLSLTGFVTYRFRETKSLSMGQFLEMRYNRSLRIFASFLRTLSELLVNCMCPALAARFMIYYLGLPYAFTVFGITVPTFLILTLIMITMCIVICCLGGNLALLITDTIQGFFCYPLMILFTIFILVKFSWNTDLVPVLMDRVKGESFLNPYEISSLRDFNVFALFVACFSMILNRGSWLGAGSSLAAKSPHEQKMAGIMGTWRGMFSSVIYFLLVLLVIVSLNGTRMAPQAKVIRDNLSAKVLEEVCSDKPELQKQLNTQLQKLPPRDHIVGGKRPQDAPLSHEKNLDTPHLKIVQSGFEQASVSKKKYQEFFTLYHQMMLPVTLRNLLPQGMIGLFALFIMLMMLSTDDSRLFSAAQTITQDCVVPFFKATISPEAHVKIIRIVCCGCGIFWFLGSFFMAQLDYIQMYISIMLSLWVGAGPIFLLGLYSRFGNTVGAFCSVITGMFMGVFGIFCQRQWASLIYPFLVQQNWDVPVGKFLAACSSPFEPWVLWRMNPYKFPINSTEISFIITLSCLLVYILGSLITYKAPYNLDRLLHRGIYNTDGEKKAVFKWSFRTVFQKLIGITPEFTRGDKIISWSVFFYTFVYKFFGTFILVVVWNIFSPWKLEWWGNYFFIVSLAVPLFAAFVSTFWFVIGGVIDMRQLFRDLRDRVANPLDNGQVAGNVSLADVSVFAEKESEKKPDSSPEKN